MTYDEYIKNPMGTGSSVITNRAMYQEMYSNKWDALMVRENGNVSYRLYKKNDDYYIHLKIPSEVVPKFYYDTIIRFYLPKDKKIKAMEYSLANYSVQFYSNDPSFVYSFAHAFKKNDLFIKDLEYKMSEKALKEKASVKNPKDQVGYVKSLYFAYLAMKTMKLFTKARWDSTATKYVKEVWNSSVTHADDKVRDRQELGLKAEKENRKKEEKKQTSNTYNTHKNPYASPNISNFGHFKKVDYNKHSYNKISSSINKTIRGIKKKIGR